MVRDDERWGARSGELGRGGLGGLQATDDAAAAGLSGGWYPLAPISRARSRFMPDNRAPNLVGAFVPPCAFLSSKMMRIKKLYYYLMAMMRCFLCCLAARYLHVPACAVESANHDSS